ncbi:cytidylyltransferase domain-containing protein [Christiangramia salexigens]|uniref:Acylneuraminate cytidylyltransferase n=1 Tax=Christiangramia salexigens TaxID=1913577 RepID=A0A1L3J2E2_9FLAO|nr:hypothetical protein [Christiangramia salexigens]APG59286.1 hypothetical protein LPB144_02160 [Christiangramia salexigens]
MSIGLFIPVRKGSERLKNKNTRKFSNFEGGLLEYKLTQLVNFDSVDEIIISTNDERCLEIITDFKDRIYNLKIDKRPDYLGATNTELSELIKYVPTISKCDNFLWSHVTSPFCHSQIYTSALQTFHQLEDFDSLMTGYAFQDFLWNKEENFIVNNKTKFEWPRTQDLEKNFVLNNAIFIANRENYLLGNRIGQNPYLMEMGKLESWDIDTEIDFKISEALKNEFFE